MSRQIDGTLGVVEDVAHDGCQCLVLPRRPQLIPYVIVEGDANVSKHIFYILGEHGGILVVEYLILMNAKHMLQDEFADHFARMGSDIDTALFHALQFVEVILQRLLGILPTLVVLGQHVDYPHRVTLGNQVLRPQFVITRRSILWQQYNGGVCSELSPVGRLSERTFIFAIVSIIGARNGILYPFQQRHCLFLEVLYARLPVLASQSKLLVRAYLEEVAPRHLVLRVLDYEAVPIVIHAVQLERVRQV